MEKERHPEQSSRCRFSENNLNNKVNKCLKWYILQRCLYFFKSLSDLLVSIILLNHVMYIIFNIAFLVVEMLKRDTLTMWILCPGGEDSERYIQTKRPLNSAEPPKIRVTIWAKDRALRQKKKQLWIQRTLESAFHQLLSVWWRADGTSGKEPACQCPCRRCKKRGLIPGREVPGEGNGNPLQCSCLENLWTEEPGR